MARKARVVAAGVPHHVTQRGNNRRDVFLTDDDRRYYLSVLRDRSQQAGLQRRAHSSYAQRFNRRYRRSGHLWQNRFYSCPLGSSIDLRDLPSFSR